MKTHALRLHPGDDPLFILEAFVSRYQFEAACVLTCVGSLRKAVIRFANQDHPITITGHFEIVSLTGVMSIHGSHYHIAISDETGKTIGGHLMKGGEVYTTVEIVITELDELRFLRSFDNQTGYPELEIKSKTEKE